MSELQKTRDNILAATLTEILEIRIHKTEGNRALIRIEGFSKNICDLVKEKLGNNYADVVWAEDAGASLISNRNNPDTSKALIVFLDAYFPESQSLAHFSKITDGLLQEDKEYLDILVKTALKNNKPSRIISDAIHKIVDNIKPSLDNLTDYLSQVGAVESGDEDRYLRMGKELYHFNVFSHEKLIVKSKYKQPPENGPCLKQSFLQSLNRNLQCSRPAYKGMFSNKRIATADISDEVKKELFNYVIKQSQEQFENIDYDDVKKVLSKKQSNQKKMTPDNDDRVEKSILWGLAKRFDGGGEYELEIEEGAKVMKLSISQIDEKNLFKPITEFNDFATEWKKILKEFSENQDRDDDDRSLVTVRRVDNNNQKSFLVDTGLMKEIDNFPTTQFGELATNANNELKIAAADFDEARGKIVQNFINYPGTTLHLDIESYLVSYISLLSIVWKNAHKWAAQEWFFELLEKVIFLDLEKKEESKSLEMLPTHPLVLSHRRLEEAMALEMLDNPLLSGEDENEILKKIQEQMYEYFFDAFPLNIPWNDWDTQPLYRKVEEGVVKYMRKGSSRITKKSPLIQALNPRIEEYIQNNPLAKDAIRLTIINPLEGEELYLAVMELSSNRKKLNPDRILITAIGPDNPQTFSHFDKHALSEEEKDEKLFQLKKNSLYPFCRYEKRLVEEKERDSSWLDDYLKDPPNCEKGDISIAIDPFMQDHKLEDRIISLDLSKKIPEVFNKLNKKELPLINILDGQNCEYFRIGIEALMIMKDKKGADPRSFKPVRNTKGYPVLMEQMLKDGEWSLIVDRYLDEYTVEQLAEQLPKALNLDMSSSPLETTEGTVYLFLCPPREPSTKESGPEDIGKPFKLWVHETYKLLIKKDTVIDSFWDCYLKNDRQWLIPFDLLPGWLCLLLEKSIKNEEEEDEDESSQSTNFLWIVFNERPDNKMNFSVQLLELKKDGETQYEPVRFFNNQKSSVNNHSPILNKLVWKILNDTMRSLIVNPYQAWFLAVLNTGSSNLLYDENLFDALFKEKRQYKTIGKVRIWRLRNLVQLLTKLIIEQSKISQEDHTIMVSLFEQLRYSCQVFVKEYLYCMEQNQDFWKTNHYLLDRLRALEEM